MFNRFFIQRERFENLVKSKDEEIKELKIQCEKLQAQVGDLCVMVIITLFNAQAQPNQQLQDRCQKYKQDVKIITAQYKKR